MTSNNGPEFSQEQIDRLDEVDNAAFDFVKVLVEEPELDWDMYHIGEVAAAAVDILTSHGFRIRYPFITEVDGEERIFDYMDEDSLA